MPFFQSEHSGDFLLGQQPENPLLLLGQYSDDEFGIQSSKSDDDLAVLSSMANDNDQVKGTLAEDCKNIDTDAVEDLTAQTVEQKGQDKDFTPGDGIINTEANDAGEIDATGAGSLSKEMDSTEQDSVLGMSAMQSGDVYSGWKMVLHEESSQYYYWNTETGETSWEIPKVLAQGTVLTFEQDTLPITQGTHESSSNLVEVGDSSAMLTKVVCGGANLISDAGKLDKQNVKVLESGNQGNESNQIQITTGSAAGSYPYGDAPFVQNYLYSENSGDALLINGESAGTGSNEHLHEIAAQEEHRNGIYISFSLISHGEFLLEKLKSLKLPEHDWVSKYVMEIEVRLFDIRALMSYGSSLLPFWEYSEKRLKQLELAMNDEISHAAKTTALSETSTDSAVKGEDKLMESLKHGNQTDEPLKGAACSSEPSVVSPNASTPFFQNYSPNEAPNNDVNAECVPPSVYSIAHLDDPVGVNGEEICNGNGLGEFVPKPGLNAGEDEDMDVDMEVDDAIPASNTIYEDTLHTGAFALPQESAVHPNPPIGYSGLISEDVSIVPPPPDDEWIPPPPPENELVPPPPPDEPEPSCPLPPTYSDALPPSYAEPYKLSYPDSNFDYYGQTITEVTSSNIYGHHVAVLHQPAYYEVIPSTYANAAPTLVNPIGNVVPIPLVAGAESSAYQSKSGTEAYSGLPTRQIGSFAAIPDVTTTDVSAVADVTLIPDAPAIANVTSVAPLDGPIISTLAQAVAVTSVIESDPVPSIKAATTSSRATTGTSATAGSSTAKIVSKALRSKKRTVSVAPSLRSNKKVSKLVDKWKAAKEELHEDDEDEPENSYDFMEKKRQREIEEWRAQQISSGEARDNANFLPLGGNWRERVKRRKAARETAPTPSEVVADEDPQPDLMPLCGDLPSGWQACWDESSKQVYYANIATSETTWTKPTK